MEQIPWLMKGIRCLRTILPLALLVGWLGLALSACDIVKAASRTEPEVKADLCEHRASIENAKRSQPYFFQRLRERDGKVFSLKILLNGGEGKPVAVWVHRVHALGERVTGHLAAADDALPRIRTGDEVSFRKRHILDWAIVDSDGTVLGAFTDRPPALPSPPSRTSSRSR